MPARVVVGRCLSYGEGITYWPLQEIVEQVGDARAALDGTTDADLAATRIAAAIAPTGAPSSPEEIAWGFRKLFEALAAQTPLVVVLDDIHWAEPVPLDLVEYVAAFAGAVLLVVVCTARPDLLESRPDWATPSGDGRASRCLLHTRVWDVARWAGDWERGEAALLEGRAMAERMGSRWLSNLELHLGEAAFLQGRLDEAERRIERGRELSADDDVFNFLKWALVAVRLRAERGDLAAAEEIARDAVERADPGEFPEDAAEAHLALADVLRRTGDAQGARAAVTEAVELFERKGNVVGAGRARAALVVLPPAPDR